MTRHTAQRLAPPLASDSRGRAAHLCKARARITDLLYVLKFILGDFCIVCTGFHCVNFTMFAQACLEFRSGTPATDKSKAKKL